MASIEVIRPVSPTRTATTLPEELTPERAVTLAEPEQSVQQGPPSGFRFWMIVISLMVTSFLSAIETTAVSTVLPTIIADLNGHDFVWVGSSFTLASTAILPMSGGLAQIFGRRPVMLGALFLFAIGSGICGGAKNMGMLIAGRTIQGMGGGGIFSASEIIVADLIPLRWRGLFMGVFGSVWAVASAIGPPIGGAFAESDWRWLFYMNVPLTGLAAVLVFMFLRVKAPKDDFKTKMGRMDWTGNFLVIASSTITIIALTWGGVKYSWSSYQVLVPLILGLVGLVVFFGYEARYAKEPVVPWTLVSNRTSLSGYLGTFLHGIISMIVVYYLPVYLQGSKMKSPIQSGVGLFGSAFTIAPFAIVCGATVAIFKIYRPQNYIAWAVSAVGLGILSLLEADSSKAMWVSFQVIEGIGVGMLYTATTFPILSALPLSESAHAMALFAFLRTFAQTWGVTIGATILQNELRDRLPSDFLAMFPAESVEIAYTAIPLIPSLSEPVQTQVRVAFAESLQIVWYVSAAICVLGFISVVLMKEIPMHEVTDEDWGLEEKKKEKDVEAYN
ncbi:hypothetical protein FRC02_011057 [Tulasnella sp. 418]|nr:hypothetical protein FRC02_011057 [Tulasnella sp. 418]